MNANQKPAFSKLLMTTLSLYDKSCDPDVVELWWSILEPYDSEDVKNGFASFVKSHEGKFAPKPASIIEMINRNRPDGRPTADEAWAMVAHGGDEAETVVATSEAMAAFWVALPLLESGDKIGARMAFKGAYEREIMQARQDGRPVKVDVTQGHDKQRREQAITAAVASGLLTPKTAQVYLPHLDATSIDDLMRLGYASGSISIR